MVRANRLRFSGRGNGGLAWRVSSRPQSGLVAHTTLRRGSLPAAEQQEFPEVQSRVILVQVLATHIEQLEALPDDLRKETIARYRRRYAACGCHTARELTSWLATESKTQRRPIARFLRVCHQLGVEARLPACLSVGKVDREMSWFKQIRSLGLARDAKADVS